MKEIEVELIVEDCTAQLYFDAIYGADAAMRAFHAKINGDPAASVGPWSDEGLRSVQFVMPMNVPAMLKKFIGLESVSVVETQKVEWLDGERKAFRVVSEPQLNFPGANKFTTSGFLEASSGPGNVCRLKATIRCSAAMPWPMQATVEGLMATEAASSIRTFLDFCRDYYAAWRAEQLARPERPAPAPAPTDARPPQAASAAAGDEFYDAVEEAAEGGEEAATVVPYQPPRLEDIIVDCLRQIQASSAETAATLRSLEELIRNMDDNMQVVREKLVGRRAPPPPPPPPRSAAAGAAQSSSPCAARAGQRSTAAPGASSSSSSSSSSLLGFLAAASLICSAGTLVYVRYRLGAGGGGSAGGN